MPKKTSPYVRMANLLKQRLSKAEFLELQEMVDSDCDADLWAALTDLAMEMAPELFEDGEDP